MSKGRVYLQDGWDESESKEYGRKGVVVEGLEWKVMSSVRKESGWIIGDLIL